MKCSKCGKETDILRFDQFENIGGKMVRLIPEGEKWCRKCCGNLDNLSTINEKFKKIKFFQNHSIK